MGSVISHSRIPCLTLMHVVLAQSKSFHGEWWGANKSDPFTFIGFDDSHD